MELLLFANLLLRFLSVCAHVAFGVPARFQANCLNLFYCLLQAGWPHARVSSLYVAGTAVLAAGLLAGCWLWVVGLAVVEFFVGFWLVRHVAVPFTLAS